MAFHTTFQAIGTTWVIDIPEELSQEKEDAVLKAIRKRIYAFDVTYSRFRSDSLVHSMKEKAGNYIFPADARLLMDLYGALYELSKGLVTPLIGSVLSDAGYDKDYSLKPKAHIAPAKRWEDVMTYTHPLLVTKEPVSLDFGALGKGYLIDIVAEVIRGEGCDSYMINAGGDIAYKNTKNAVLQVGLEHPDNKEQVIGIATIANISICGSSGNRRNWGAYHHIINPQTVTSPRHIAALWVVASTTLLADAMTTALFFVEPDVLLKQYSFEYAIMYSDKSLKVSPSFPGTFF